MFAARSILVLGAALFGGSYLAAAAGACDRLSLQFASHPKVAIAGKDIKLSYSIIVGKGSSTLKESSVVIGLDKDVTYKNSGAGLGKTSSSGDYDAAENEVVWEDIVAKTRKMSYWVKGTVSSNAQILTFDASAEVKLSTGEVCMLEALPSVVRIRGYESATLPVTATAALQTAYPYASVLDANEVGADGYVERVLVSKEGIELVHACFLEGKGTAAITQARGGNEDTEAVQTYLFVRNSTASTPTSVQPSEWWGLCDRNKPRLFSQRTDNNLGLNYCLGERRGGQLGNLGQGTGGLTNAITLYNDNGGSFAILDEKSAFVGLNLDTGDQAVCYEGGMLYYTPSSVV